MSKRSLIRAAASQYDVDLDHAICATDDDPESDRIYIIEDTRVDGYRLISYGLDADGRSATEDPIRIPDSAVGPVQGLLHAAGMHVVEHLESDRPISIRHLAQGMGLSKPLDPEDLDEGDAGSDGES